MRKDYPFLPNHDDYLSARHAVRLVFIYLQATLAYKLESSFTKNKLASLLGGKIIEAG